MKLNMIVLSIVLSIITLVQALTAEQECIRDTGKFTALRLISKELAFEYWDGNVMDMKYKNEVTKNPKEGFIRIVKIGGAVVTIEGKNLTQDGKELYEELKMENGLIVKTATNYEKNGAYC